MAYCPSRSSARRAASSKHCQSRCFGTSLTSQSLSGSTSRRPCSRGARLRFSIGASGWPAGRLTSAECGSCPACPPVAPRRRAGGHRRRRRAQPFDPLVTDHGERPVFELSATLTLGFEFGLQLVHATGQRSKRPPKILLRGNRAEVDVLRAHAATSVGVISSYTVLGDVLANREVLSPPNAN